MPTISIIVPVYKVEKWLERCVRSILAQTFRDFEVILVDDGSPDRSGEMCDALAQGDPRIQVIHKKNGGLSDARNAGIDAAAGEYLMFTDSDDYIEPETLEKMYHAVCRENAALCICNYKVVFETGTGCQADNHQMIPPKVCTAREITKRCAQDSNPTWVVACNKLYHRSLWENIRFPVGKIHEDEFMFHQTILQCERIVCISDVCYNYVMRESSIMHSPSPKAALDGTEALLERIRYYRMAHFSVPEISSTLLSAIQKINSFFPVQKNADKESRKRYKNYQKQIRRFILPLLKERDVPNPTKIYLVIKFIFPYLSWKFKSISDGSRIYGNKK